MLGISAINKRLNKRERYAVYFGLAGLVIFALVQFVISPAFEKRSHLKRSVAIKDRVLSDMLALKSEFDTLKEQTRTAQQRFLTRNKQFTLFSFLDRLADQTGVKRNISSMKPSTSDRKKSDYKISRVEMKLEDITFEQLLVYLHGIETTPNMVWINRLSITKTGKKLNYVKAIIQVETLEI